MCQPANLLTREPDPRTQIWPTNPRTHIIKQVWRFVPGWCFQLVNPVTPNKLYKYLYDSCTGWYILSSQPTTHNYMNFRDKKIDLIYFVVFHRFQMDRSHFHTSKQSTHMSPTKSPSNNHNFEVQITNRKISFFSPNTSHLQSNSQKNQHHLHYHMN